MSYFFKNYVTDVPTEILYNAIVRLFKPDINELIMWTLDFRVSMS